MNIQIAKPFSGQDVREVTEPVRTGSIEDRPTPTVPPYVQLRSSEQEYAIERVATART